MKRVSLKTLTKTDPRPSCNRMGKRTPIDGVPHEPMQAEETSDGAGLKNQRQVHFLRGTKGTTERLLANCAELIRKESNV